MDDKRTPGRRHHWMAALAVLLVLTGLQHGGAVPWGNENFYLIRLYRLGHPDFLANDWTLRQPAPEHWLFNHIAGPLSIPFDIETFGAMGRLAGWIGGLAVLLVVAREAGLTAPLAALALALWLGSGQSIVARSWMLKTFEAKTFAYAALFLSLRAVSRSAVEKAGLWAGLATALHPSVGGWGAITLLPALRRPPSARRAAAAAALFAVPAAVGILPLLLAPGGVTSAEEWRYMALVKMPEHLDPATWPVRRLVLLGVLFAVNVLVARSQLWERPLWRAATVWQAAAASVFAAGCVARVAGFDRFLATFPFRLFPLLTPLFFFLGACAWAAEGGWRQAGMALRAFLIAALAAVPSPLFGLADAARPALTSWFRAPTDLERALGWCRDRLPEDAVLVAPPWFRGNWSVSRRAIVASRVYHPYTSFREWRERCDLLLGPVGRGTGEEELAERYRRLTAGAVREAARRYGATHVVIDAELPLRKLAAFGEWCVYEIGGEAVEPGGNSGSSAPESSSANRPRGSTSKSRT
ncbi:MAG: hypothetical protein D6718_11040 [Acidobacteria bacterium]|nr:MAG: hypothetical protein D6718_11040 [Acidobacteriota bacterium]